MERRKSYSIKDDFVTDEQWGKTEQKIDQCLEGIKDIKGHISDIYKSNAKQETEIALVKDNIGKVNIGLLKNNVAFLQKVSWTIASALIVLVVGSLYKLIAK